MTASPNEPESAYSNPAVRRALAQLAVKASDLKAPSTTKEELPSWVKTLADGSRQQPESGVVKAVVTGPDGRRITYDAQATMPTVVQIQPQGLVQRIFPAKTKYNYEVVALHDARSEAASQTVDHFEIEKDGLKFTYDMPFEVLRTTGTHIAQGR